jgi:hypothetical protein
MKQAIDKWTMTASCVLVVGALLACKKKTEEPAPVASIATPPAVSIAPLPVATAPVATAAPVAVDAGVAPPAPVLGDVKRFPDKEKPATGAVKVTGDNSFVYNEPDDKTPSVASLTKDIFVERLATIGTDWVLVDFPSGVGKLSPGWIEATSVGAKVAAVTHATVAAQTTTATLAGSAKPATSAAAATSAKPATTAVVTATAKPATTATTPPAATAPPAATVKAKPQMLARPKP